REVRWVEPRMVIESQFRGWTSDGLVRQAAFKGLREDKPPQEVFREMPVMTMASTTRRGSSVAKGAAQPGRSMATRSRDTRKARCSRDGDMRFTHPERVYWGDVGVTKQNLADYYRLVWDRMAPNLVNRPLALLRCPDGTEGECFFQKHASSGLGRRNLRVVIDKKRRQVLAVETLDGLLSLVQAGVLEVHVRGSMIDRLDRCNRIVVDIDPGEDVSGRRVVAAAREVRARLAAVNLHSFVKLTGGKGLHVVVPVGGVDWDTAKTFTQAVALAMTADAPGRYV